MLVKDRVKNVLEILSNKFGDAKTEVSINGSCYTFSTMYR